MNYILIQDIKSKFGINGDKNYSIDILKKCCDLANITIERSSNNFFITKGQSIEHYFENIQKFSMKNITIFYERKNTKHAKYEYFSFLCIKESDMAALRKMFKLYNLKAFL
jgi:hypothetical protein